MTVVSMWCAKGIATVKTQRVYWLLKTSRGCTVSIQLAVRPQTVTVPWQFNAALLVSCTAERCEGIDRAAEGEVLTASRYVLVWNFTRRTSAVCGLALCQRSLSCSRQYTSLQCCHLHCLHSTTELCQLLSHTCTTSHRSAVLTVPWRLTHLSDTTRQPLGAVSYDEGGFFLFLLNPHMLASMHCTDL